MSIFSDSAMYNVPILLVATGATELSNHKGL